MTFTGSLYHLNGSIDVQKMEGNGMLRLYFLLPGNCCSVRKKRVKKSCHIYIPLLITCWLSFLTGFSKDVIQSFRNGFPANWKTILGKEYEKQAASTASMGKESSTDKRVDTIGQNDHSALKRQEIPLTQQPRESVQRGKSVIQQEKQQLRQVMQEERQMVMEITPGVDSPRMIGEAPRRPPVAPVERAPVQVKSVSLPFQDSILEPPKSRTFNKDVAVESVTPVASIESLSEGSSVSKATIGTTDKNPESISEASSFSLCKELAPTSAALPVSTWIKVQEEVTATGLPLTPRRASVPENASLQEDTPALRRASAPDQSITAMGTWKTVRPAYIVDRPLDRALDGNLRMRSKAVVEQIRERTRQHPDLSSVVVDRAVEDG